MDLEATSREMQGITQLSKQHTRRKTSLFEAERPFPTRSYDPGISVMTHADFPIKGTRRTSLTAVGDDSRTRTSQRAPQPGEFDVPQVTTIIRKTLENGLSNRMYNPKDCGPLTRELVNTLKEKVSELRLPGHKLICTCCVTKRATPTPSIESGCAWDASMTSISQDRFAEYIYKNDDILAVGTVFGVQGSKKVAEKLSRKSSKQRAKDIVATHSPIPES